MRPASKAPKIVRRQSLMKGPSKKATAKSDRLDQSKETIGLNKSDQKMFARTRKELETKRVLSPEVRAWLRGAFDPSVESSVQLVGLRKRGRQRAPYSIGKAISLTNASDYARALFASGEFYERALEMAAKKFAVPIERVRREYGQGQKMNVPIPPLGEFTGAPVTDEAAAKYDKEWEAFRQACQNARSDEEVREEAEFAEEARFDDFVQRIVSSWIERMQPEIFESLVRPAARRFSVRHESLRTERGLDRAVEVLIQQLLETTEELAEKKIRAQFIEFITGSKSGI